MCDGYPLVIVQPHLLGKEQGEAAQRLERHPQLVLRGDADFDAQELVFATAVVVVDQLHRLAKRPSCSSSCLSFGGVFPCR